MYISKKFEYSLIFEYTVITCNCNIHLTKLYFFINFKKNLVFIYIQIFFSKHAFTGNS